MTTNGDVARFLPLVQHRQPADAGVFPSGRSDLAPYESFSAARASDFRRTVAPTNWRASVHFCRCEFLGGERVWLSADSRRYRSTSADPGFDQFGIEPV